MRPFGTGWSSAALRRTPALSGGSETARRLHSSLLSPPGHPTRIGAHVAPLGVALRRFVRGPFALAASPVVASLALQLTTQRFGSTVSPLPSTTPTTKAMQFEGTKVEGTPTNVEGAPGIPGAAATPPKVEPIIAVAASAAEMAAIAAHATALQKAYTASRAPADLAKLKDFIEQTAIAGIAFPPPPASTRDKTSAALIVSAVPLMPDDVAGQLIALANAAKVKAACPVVAAVVAWASAPGNVACVGPMALGRILQGCVSLHPPGCFDVLIGLVWRTVEIAPSMDVTSLSAVINAYGRSGVRHAALYRALISRALQAFNPAHQPIPGTTPTMAQLANVVHALSRAGAMDPALFTLLAGQAVAMAPKAPPLVVATVLDAYAPLSPAAAAEPGGNGSSPPSGGPAATPMDPALEKAVAALFDAYEARAVAVINECGCALVASLLQSLGKAGRFKSPLFAAAAARGIAIAGSFDAPSIARTIHAFHQANQRSEELFGLLAERACRLTPELRLSEVRQVLEALAAFGLYDAELFPLLASRVVSITRQRMPYNFDDLAGVLGAFATVQERNEDLVNALAPIIRHNVATMSGWALATLLWAFATLGIRNDVAAALAAAAAPAAVAAVTPVMEGGEVPKAAIASASGRITLADRQALGEAKWKTITETHGDLLRVAAVTPTASVVATAA